MPYSISKYCGRGGGPSPLRFRGQPIWAARQEKSSAEAMRVDKVLTGSGRNAEPQSLKFDGWSGRKALATIRTQYVLKEWKLGG